MRSTYYYYYPGRAGVGKLENLDQTRLGEREQIRRDEKANNPSCALPNRKHREESMFFFRINVLFNTLAKLHKMTLGDRGGGGGQILHKLSSSSLFLSQGQQQSQIPSNSEHQSKVIPFRRVSVFALLLESCFFHLLLL